MKLSDINNNNIRIKDGRILKFEIDDSNPYEIEVLPYLDGVRCGNFTLHLFQDQTAQIDSFVPGKFRRLGVATAVYNFLDRFAKQKGYQLFPAENKSDLANQFWNNYDKSRTN